MNNQSIEIYKQEMEAKSINKIEFRQNEHAQFQEQQNQCSNSQSASQLMDQEQEEEQKWEDLPVAQKLQGKEQTYSAMIELTQTKQQEKQKQDTKDSQNNIKNQSPQNNQIKISDKIIKEPRFIKSKQIPFNSKSIYAAYDLLKHQFSNLLKKQQGFIKFNPYQNNRFITIFYYDQTKLQEIQNKIDKYVQQIQHKDMKKCDAQFGLQLSFKYFKNLLKQKITFFNDVTQNYRTASYCISGRVKLSVLCQKLKQIQNTTFAWFNLFKYANTRSYRAILRNIFQIAEFRETILQKNKATQVEVAYLRKNFPEPLRAKFKTVMIVLTYYGRRKITNVKEIEEQIQNQIQQKYAVFCFSFPQDMSKQKKKLYAPKIDKVTWFFINQTKLQFPVTYLFIIVKKSDFVEVRQNIIDEIQKMNLGINRRRFFKNLHPTKQQVPNKDNYFIFEYPKYRPYSWSYAAKKGQKFDWISHLIL